MYTMLCVSVRCFDGIHVFPQGDISLICCITDSIIVGVSLPVKLGSSYGGGFARIFMTSRRCASIRLMAGKTVRVRCLLV